MWRGTTMPGNRTRLGRGNRAISIKSYEEFFVLPRLIDGAASLSEKKGAKTPAETLGYCGHFARGTHDRILNDVRGLIDQVDNVLAHAVKTRQLHVLRVHGAGDHRFNPPA